ncbi:Amuc_1099 family pilus-like system protein [Rubritalea tangerina]|uniref:Amuc_1099 family pilus-like system protein n=1 Tax=Rubritalea tangerina TaxID=430798 RepID=A0ABW4ZEI5_9BACT
MSWIKENYEKAALGGAAAILVGVVATSVFGGGDKPSDKQLSFDRNDDPGTEKLAEISSVLEAREKTAIIRPKVIDGREVDLFVGQKLYVAEGSTTPLDPYESKNIHEGIANEWWRKHGIDPSFANAPERDFDKDGFTNREEYDAQTNPADATKYPSPLSKVVGNEALVFKMQMRWSSFDADSITLYYRDNNREKFNERVQHGAKFFSADNAKIKNKGLEQRFVLGAGSQKVQDPNGREQDAYTVTDTDPLYKGTDRETFTLLRKGAFDGGHNEVQDRSVKLTLHALGKEGEPFTVREFEKFSLPYDPKAEVKPYRVARITPVIGQKEVYTVELEGEIDGKKESKTLTVRRN